MKFLFVCTGNLFRSRLEEAIATKIFGKDHEFDSCGVGAKEYGKHSPKKLREQCSYLKVDNEIFLRSSKEITFDLIKWADIIVYQQKNHFEQLMKIDFTSEKKYKFLGDFTKQKVTRIPDLAFISNLDEYKRVVVLIVSATVKLVVYYAK